MGIKGTKKNDPVISFKKIATEIIFKYYQKISIQKTALNTQVRGTTKTNEEVKLVSTEIILNIFYLVKHVNYAVSKL